MQEELEGHPFWVKGSKNYKNWRDVFSSMLFAVTLIINIEICLSGDQAGAVYVKLADCHLKVILWCGLLSCAEPLGLTFFFVIFLFDASWDLSVFPTLYLQLDSKHEAANAYADAAHCYKKTNTKGAFLSGWSS